MPIPRPVIEVRWDWLAQFDQRIQHRQQSLLDAKEMLTVGTWFQVLINEQWSTPFRVMQHKPKLLLFATKEEQRQPPIRHRRLKWTHIALKLDQLKIRFLNPDGTLLE